MKTAPIVVFIVLCACVLISCNQMGPPDQCPKLWLRSPGPDQTGLGKKVLFQWVGTPWNPDAGAQSPRESCRALYEIDHYVLLYGQAANWDSETDIVRVETTATSVESNELYYDTEYYWLVAAFQWVPGSSKEEPEKLVWTQVGPRQFTTMKEPGEMVTIPAGQFTMGDHFHPEWTGGETAPWYLMDQPAHDVALSKSFQIGKYEVTNQEFVAFLNSVEVPFYDDDLLNPGEGKGWLNGHPLIHTNWDDPSMGICYDTIDSQWKIKTSWTNTNVEPNVTVPLNYAAMPVVNVSWYGAAYYCDWLSQMLGYEEAYDSSSGTLRSVPRDNGGFRLPTEAEWEYCARGGGGDTLYSGTSIFPANYAWFAWNSDIGDGTGMRVHEVGQKLPNELELYDMTGNVFEICSDWWGLYCAEYGEAGCPVLLTDPAGPEQPDPPVYFYKVMRGGSWSTEDGDDGQTYLSNVRRHSIFPENMESNVGFRVARTLPPGNSEN
ncbi:MAG TPA: SUMF1/EgtB/PvdO family nonheme iron enzyme [Thermotogota bacterium]|nr:SUMF1/EgtB/PvdO family nonheme iron enzyme [Thermotogota bacterium]HPH11068.1 SUMF1/EgtB/PvdO family nonheme iron enzyme [Thermotogota bacterium]HQN23168.1 SUMF1/EgtB/PvdO family nonheme iron enzyme [Thermotogota bacterium]HQQ66975.1 SUMF1/EgtB/PvdO family nonheme iron enzyme [Thermotogota bacterium]